MRPRYFANVFILKKYRLYDSLIDMKVTEILNLLKKIPDKVDGVSLFEFINKISIKESYFSKKLEDFV